MATFNKVNVFVKDVASGAHVFGTHVIKAMLTNTAPTATSAVKADITEITAANGYSAGGPTLSTTSSTQTSGVYKLVLGSATVTATGAVGPFRYVVIYNDTQTTPAKPIIGHYDYGSAVTMANGDTFTITPDATNGILTIT